MKLIDLDKALAEAEDECRMSDDWKVAHEMMNVFKYQPTVKAIPIKWIRKYTNHRTVEFGEMGIFIDCMINDWEKENERMDNR